jgi:hypothetical protein
MGSANDLLHRARRCRKTAEAMRAQADRHEAAQDLEVAIRRRRSAANLEALASDLERQATDDAPAVLVPYLWRSAST